jgi:hypothetical protein
MQELRLVAVIMTHADKMLSIAKPHWRKRYPDMIR